MSNKSTVLLEHHLKELAPHIPEGVRQGGKPVRRRGG